MVRSVEFKAAFGDVVKNGRLYQPHNCGGGSWEFTLNDFYQGALWKRGDVWVFYGNAEKEYTFEDIQILGEMIEEESRVKGWSNLFGFDHDNRLDSYFNRP